MFGVKRTLLVRKKSDVPGALKVGYIRDMLEVTLFYLMNRPFDLVIIYWKYYLVQRDIQYYLTCGIESNYLCQLERVPDCVLEHVPERDLERNIKKSKL